MTGVDQPLALEDLASPALGDRDVVVEVEASGVCHSDLTVRSGGVPYPLPLVLGHEGAGRVREVGAAVTRVRVGDRVVASFTPTCGGCWHCLQDESHLCADATGTFTPRASRRDGTAVLGMSGLGTFADVMTVPESFVVAVRSDLPSEQLALIGCGATTGLGAALNTGKVAPGATVGVLGAGGVGLFTIMGARLAGAARIIAVDPVAAKREAALAVGATDVVNPADGGTLEQLQRLTRGHGVDYCFDVVGAPQVIQQAITATRRGGTAVLVGMPRMDQTVSLGAFDLFYGAKKILGCHYGSARVRTDFQRWIDLVEAGRLDFSPVISSRYALADVNAALQDLQEGRVLRGVLV